MKGRAIVYSAAELAWLEENRLLVIGDYHAGFVARFGRDDVSAVNLNGLRKRKGWSTGRSGRFVKGMSPVNKGKPCAPGEGGRHPNARKTQFKKGHLPASTKYLGHERISKDGYVEVSIDEVNPHTGFGRRYAQKHLHLWEKQNGKVPEGHCLKCLDGDKTNTDPTNWECIPRALLPRLNGRFGRQYDQAPAALKPTIMATAKLEHAARSARQRLSRRMGTAPGGGAGEGRAAPDGGRKSAGAGEGRTAADGGEKRAGAGEGRNAADGGKQI